MGFKQIIGLSLFLVLLVGNGCNRSKETVLGASKLGNQVVAAVYQKLGIDDAILSLKIQRGKKEAYYLLQFSSYPGFPKTRLKFKYSELSKTLWVIGSPIGGEDFVAAYVLETDAFYDKHGRLLNPSASLDIRTPEYESGSIPLLTFDAKEILTVAY